MCEIVCPPCLSQESPSPIRNLRRQALWIASFRSKWKCRSGMVLGESTYLQGFSFYLFLSLHSMIDPLMVVLADFSETCKLYGAIEGIWSPYKSLTQGFSNRRQRNVILLHTALECNNDILCTRNEDEGDSGDLWRRHCRPPTILPWVTCWIYCYDPGLVFLCLLPTTILTATSAACRRLSTLHYELWWFSAITCLHRNKWIIRKLWSHWTKLRTRSAESSRPWKLKNLWRFRNRI